MLLALRLFNFTLRQSPHGHKVLSWFCFAVLGTEARALLKPGQLRPAFWHFAFCSALCWSGGSPCAPRPMLGYGAVLLDPGMVALLSHCPGRLSLLFPSKLTRG